MSSTQPEEEPAAVETNETEASSPAPQEEHQPANTANDNNDDDNGPAPEQDTEPPEATDSTPQEETAPAESTEETTSARQDEAANNDDAETKPTASEDGEQNAVKDENDDATAPEANANDDAEPTEGDGKKKPAEEEVSQNDEGEDAASPKEEEPPVQEAPNDDNDDDMTSKKSEEANETNNDGESPASEQNDDHNAEEKEEEPQAGDPEDPSPNSSAALDEVSDIQPAPSKHASYRRDSSGSYATTTRGPYAGTPLPSLLTILRPYCVPQLTASTGCQTIEAQRPAKNSKPSFSEQRGLKLLSLDRVQRGTFVTHAQRQALEQIEATEERERAEMEEACDEEYRIGFSFLSRTLLEMHVERVATHQRMAELEWTARLRWEAIEEEHRMPISHAKCAAEWNHEFLQQILKRGAILEDDMKRERKFTSREEAEMRRRLFKQMVEAEDTVREKARENIVHMNIQASSFAKAAAAFHATVYEMGPLKSQRVELDSDVRHSLHMQPPKTKGAGDDEEDDSDDDVTAGVRFTPFQGTTKFRIGDTVKIQEVLAAKPARFSKKRMDMFVAGEATNKTSAGNTSGSPVDPKKKTKKVASPVASPDKSFSPSASVALSPPPTSPTMTFDGGRVSRSYSVAGFTSPLQQRKSVAGTLRKQWWVNRSEMSTLKQLFKTCMSRTEYEAIQNDDDAEDADDDGAPKLLNATLSANDQETGSSSETALVVADKSANIVEPPADDAAARDRLKAVYEQLEAFGTRGPQIEDFEVESEGDAALSGYVGLLLEGSALLGRIEAAEPALTFALQAVVALRAEANDSVGVVRNSFFTQVVAGMHNLALAAAECPTPLPKQPGKAQATSAMKNFLPPPEIAEMAAEVAESRFGGDHPLTQKARRGVNAVFQAHAVPRTVRWRKKKLPELPEPRFRAPDEARGKSRLADTLSTTKSTRSPSLHSQRSAATTAV